MATSAGKATVDRAKSAGRVAAATTVAPEIGARGIGANNLHEALNG
jgi:ribosomal protein L11